MRSTPSEIWSRDFAGPRQRQRFSLLPGGRRGRLAVLAVLATGLLTALALGSSNF